MIYKIIKAIKWWVGRKNTYNWNLKSKDKIRLKVNVKIKNGTNFGVYNPNVLTNPCNRDMYARTEILIESCLIGKFMYFIFFILAC